MTNRERYKQAFGVLHASAEIKLEAEMTDKSNIGFLRRAVIICVCVVLLLGIGVTAYAAGGELKKIFGWGGNAEIIYETDENGEEKTYVYLHTESLTEPVEIDGGNIYFVVNGEHLNITEHLKEGVFHYDYKDEDGNTHYWIIGLNREELESYGYGEYVRDAEGNWVGGYSARANTEADGRGPEWLEIGKDEINIPW